MSNLRSSTSREATKQRLLIQGQKLRQILSKHKARLSDEVQASIKEALIANREALAAIDALDALK